MNLEKVNNIMKNHNIIVSKIFENDELFSLICVEHKHSMLYSLKGIYSRIQQSRKNGVLFCVECSKQICVKSETNICVCDKCIQSRRETHQRPYDSTEMKLRGIETKIRRYGNRSNAHWMRPKNQTEFEKFKEDLAEHIRLNIVDDDE